MKYYVVVYETTKLTFAIEADSPEEARDRYEDDLDFDPPEPEEEFLGGGGVEAVLDAEGNELELQD